MDGTHRTAQRYRLLKGVTPYLFLAPSLGVLLTFSVVPIVISIFLGFTSWDLFTPPRWVGVANYGFILRDPVFRKSLANTLYYVVAGTTFNVIISLFVAMAVNEAWFRGKTLIRVSYFLPVVASMVAVGYVWKYLFSPQYGLVNYVLSWLRVPQQPWIYSPKQAMDAHVVVSVWKFMGYNLVIFLAGLQGIPRQYYEAAMIDGANPRQTFLHITIPLLRPVLIFVIVTSVIGSFQVFDQVFVMSGGTGGPAYSTLTVVMYLYKKAFDALEMGLGCAVATLAFLFLAGATGLGVRVLGTLGPEY